MPLAEQDRTLWDETLISEGIGLVEAALPTAPSDRSSSRRRSPPCTPRRNAREDTDWPQIDLYHARRPRSQPGRDPQPRGRRVDGRRPARRSRLLDPLTDDPAMRRQHHPAGTRRTRHLLELDGRLDEARRRTPERPCWPEHPRAALPQPESGTTMRRPPPRRPPSPAARTPCAGRVLRRHPGRRGDQADPAWATVTGPRGGSTSSPRRTTGRPRGRTRPRPSRCTSTSSSTTSRRPRRACWPRVPEFDHQPNDDHSAWCSPTRPATRSA